MPTDYNKPHLSSIENFSQGLDYQYPNRPVIKQGIASRNRSSHGNMLLDKFNEIKETFGFGQKVELPENVVSENVIYVEFISEWGYDLDKLNTDAQKPKFHILNIKPEADENGTIRHRVLVMLTEGAISDFIKKVEKYLLEETKSGNPKNELLIANIAEIQQATLRAFWTDEPEIPFPETENVWWEAWFRKSETGIDQLITNLDELGIQSSPAILQFPEHIVRLIKGTAEQLSSSLILLDNLSELRKPQEIADFVLNESYREQQEWVRDLKTRANISLNENSVVICLLDSGVNKHPLLEDVLSNDRIYTIREDWGVNDGEDNGGHGTPMAGLAVYGDLHDALDTPENIEILHGLESFKIYNPASETDPELYGSVYEYACASPIAINPFNPRVFCLSVTNNYFKLNGRPSSSSSSIDQIAFGEVLDPPQKQLILVSGGNVYINHRDEYPKLNKNESVQDPAQAYNTITVGSYTRKDHLDTTEWPGWEVLGQNGAMAPSNSTSLIWENKKWPNKPDIVMEGGNMGINPENGKTDMKDSLQLLSTSKSGDVRPFTSFGDTSAAVALASKMAAELRTAFPDFWPETIRALMIHSADWTEAMKSEFDLSKKSNYQGLIRTVGYGVPVLRKALKSANNSLTLISQNQIQPYILEKGSQNVKYNQYHLYELPWPREVLMNEVGAADAKLTVTLSYFIEPNPGNRQYSSHFSYHSHELDFKLIKPGETLEEFQKRISAATREDNEDLDTSGEEWELGQNSRKGSVKKDFAISSGADLATQHTIAVYPKNGWYKLRKALKKYDQSVRYSLIVTIETDESTVDLYTPVYNMIHTPIEITN